MFRQPGDDRREARFTRGAVTQRVHHGGTPPATYYDRLTGKSGLSLGQVNELGFDPNDSWLNPNEMIGGLTEAERQSMQKLQGQQRAAAASAEYQALSKRAEDSRGQDKEAIQQMEQMTGQFQPQIGRQLRAVRPHVGTGEATAPYPSLARMSRPDIYRGGQMQLQPQPGRYRIQTDVQAWKKPQDLDISNPLPGGGSFPPQPNFQVPMSNRSPGIVPPHLSMGRRDIMPGGGFNPHQPPMPPMGNRFGGGMGGGMRGGMGGGGGMQQFMQFMQTMMQMFQQMQGGNMGGRQGGGYGGGYGGPMRGGYGGGFQNQMRKPYRDTSSPYGGY